ncbi:MAG: radical SAM protein [Candidatus Woesearchaeota archaeon]
MEFSYENIDFTDAGSDIEAVFMRRFYFTFQKPEGATVSVGVLNAPGKAERKIENAIAKGLSNLKVKGSDRPAFFVHDMPLMGSNAFGLIDRGTNLIELRPITGCNLDCIYCSVNQDKRTMDFVVDCDSMIEEFKRLVKFKQTECEAHIGPQGEPLLYSDLARLVKGASEVARVSMDTNATLLTKSKVDELVSCGLDQFNVSIDAVSQEKAERLAGCPYKLSHVMEMISYISEKAELVIAPILVPGFNEPDMEELVKLAKKLKARIGIQNFLSYKYGKTPAKPWEFEKFYKHLEILEKKYDMKLIMGPKDFGIHPAPFYDTPFRKGDIIDVQIICDGRLPKEKIGVCKGWLITIVPYEGGGKIKARVTRTKHNVFYAEPRNSR